LTASAFGGAARADEATDQYNVASGFFKLNRFELAAEEYEKFLKAYPKHEQVPEALYFLGESYYQLDKTEQARTQFREVVAKHANSRNYFYALYRVGETSQLLEDWKTAEPALAEFVAKRPDDPLLEFALPSLGRVQLQLGKRPESKTTLRSAIDKFPKGRLVDQSQFDLAQTLEQLGEKDEAIKLYTAVAANVGSKFADDAQLAIGTRYFEDKNFDAAMQAFLELERKFPASPWVASAKLNRALCLYQLKRFDQAQALLEAQAQGESKEVPEAWYWLGMTQKARGQLDVATKTLLDGYAKFGSTPVAAEMLFYAALAQFQQGQFGPALERLQEFSTKFSKHELVDDSLYYAAESARAAGQHEKMFPLATRLYKEFPQSPLTNPMALAIGQSLIALKRNDEAAKHLADLLSRKPAPEVAVPAQYFRAVALHAGGKIDDAIKALEPLLVDPPKELTEPAVVQVFSDAQFLTGSCYFEKKDYAKAVEPLQKYLATRPTGEVAGHALSYLAVSFAALGQFNELRGSLDSLRTKAGKELSLPAIFRVAEACFEAKQYPLAADLYTEVAQKDPQGSLHAKALSGLGWARYQEIKYAPAAQAFAQLVEAHPADPLAAEASYMRGRALEADNRPADAAAAYQAALNTYGQSPHAFDAGLQLARALQKLQKAPEAIAVYEDLTKRFSQAKQLDVVLYEWAWALQQKGQEADAQKIFERLATQFPNSELMSEAVINVCETLFQAKQFAEVVARLKPLLAKATQPQVREAALYRLGRTQVELGTWSEVKTTLELLVTEFPSGRLRRESEFWIAEADRQQGQQKAAVDRLAKLVAEQAPPEPWLGTAYLRMAQAQSEQKQWKEALVSIEQLRKRFPKFEQMNIAEYHAGRALQNLARFDEARAAYKRGIAGQKDENAAQCQFMIGETYFHQKRFQEAGREFLKVEILYAFPQWQAGALLEAGKCHESLQEWSRAVETYNRIIEKYPKTTHFTEATQRRAAAQQKLTASPSKK
jgi:TolA-binding protein